MALTITGCLVDPRWSFLQPAWNKNSTSSCNIGTFINWRESGKRNFDGIKKRSSPFTAVLCFDDSLSVLGYVGCGVTSVYDQGGEVHDSIVVDVGVIGGDDYRIY